MFQWQSVKNIVHNTDKCKPRREDNEYMVIVNVRKEGLDNLDISLTQLVKPAICCSLWVYEYSEPRMRA